ncbi:MAG TPA: hypothetical protein VF089_09320, partial [Candidatus Binatia bacterium]
MIQSGAVQILSLGIDDIPRMRELMRKYRDLPMDLADAGLVRVAERERLRRTFTLDRRDFQVYRRHESVASPSFHLDRNFHTFNIKQNSVVSQDAGRAYEDRDSLSISQA